MLTMSGLPMRFWGEAALHACYLINVTGSSAIDGKTPYEVLFNRQPDVSRIRVFGCATYVHIPKEARKLKLSPRSKPTALLGHQDGMYRVWDFEKNEVHVSKNAKFDEELLPAKSSGISEDVNELDEMHNVNEVVIDLFKATGIIDPVQDSAVEEATANEPEKEVQNPPEDEETATERRYPTRVRFAPDRYRANTARRGVDEDMPTLNSAMLSEERDKWKVAIKSEIDALEKMGTMGHCG